mmetsp:Transcript_13434/g.24311  ORF Transcript_13434/g.24311 Transcript_13434/m.24311 type:complete len:84 (+) Transcript_13434:1645-1896(+)
MSYGLIGFIAIRRTANGGGEGNDTTTHTSADVTAQQGRAFFTGAKDYLSGLGREAAKTYQSRPAGGRGGGAANNDAAHGNADS